MTDLTDYRSIRKALEYGVYHDSGGPEPQCVVNADDLRALLAERDAAVEDARRWKDDLSEVAHELVSLLGFYGLSGERHPIATAAAERAHEVLAALAATEKEGGK